MVSSQNTAPIRLLNVQALRGVAAFLVLISHLLIIDRKYSGDPFLPDAFGLGLVGVDLFFVISGFIMVYITANWKDAAGRKIPEFLFARITRIYPIYWLVSAAVLAVYLVRPDMVFASSETPPNIIKSFFLIPDESFPLLEVGWTLVHEMGFYVVFALLLFLPARFRLWGLAVWAAIIGLAHVLDWHALGPVAAIAFHPLSLEFIAGALAGYVYVSKTDIRPLWLAVIGALAVLASVLFIPDFAGFFALAWPRVIVYTLPAVMIILGLSGLEKQGRILPRWSIKLGDWSYSLYLTHVLTLSLIGRIWTTFAQPGPLDNIIVAIVMIAAAIAGAGLTYYLFERPFIRVARTLRRKWFTQQLQPHP